MGPELVPVSCAAMPDGLPQMRMCDQSDSSEAPHDRSRAPGAQDRFGSRPAPALGPRYLSPEEIQGRPAEPASDVYRLPGIIRSLPCTEPEGRGLICRTHFLASSPADAPPPSAVPSPTDAPAPRTMPEPMVSEVHPQMWQPWGPPYRCGVACRDNGAGWNYRGICPECQAQENTTAEPGEPEENPQKQLFH